MSDDDAIISIIMVFALPYSFEYKLGQLPYLDNDCENSAKEKSKIIEINQKSGLIFSTPTLSISCYLRSVYIITNFNND
jgi:hypothetical protein